MKKILLSVMVLGQLLVLTSCLSDAESNSPAVEDQTNTSYYKDHNHYCYSIREVELNGHKYVVAHSWVDPDFCRPGGVSIIHSESCPCKNN